MKPKPERPVGRVFVLLARASRDDCRQMTPGFPSLASVRKELRGVAVRAPGHIIDRGVRNAGRAKLKSYQSGEVSMRLAPVAPNDSAPAGGAFDFARDFFANLERGHANVWAYRDDEFCGVMGKRLEGAWHDASHCATPPSVHRGDIAARRVSDEDRHAVGRARRHSEAARANDERVPFHVGKRLHVVERANFTHARPMNLPLFEQTIVGHTQFGCKA